MNQINVKEKRLGRKYTEQNKKTHKNIKEEINKYERKITDDIRKEKGHKKLRNIVNTLRGKKKHDTTKEKQYDINETEFPTEEWTEHIRSFLGKVY